MRNFNIISLLHGTHVFQRDIDSILDSTTASVYWKDKQGIYMGMNQSMLMASLFETESDMIGKHDIDMPWAEQAETLLNNDQEVIKSETAKVIIEAARSFQDQKICLFLAHKIPLKNNLGKITGIFGISYQIEGDPSVLSLLKNPYFDLLEPNDNVLTERQTECLILLIKGMSHKQIANHLKLSARTVEHYLETIKNKLGCISRSELISKALQMPDIKRRLLL